MTEPTGSNSGSAATMPLCAATPAVVTSPLQYAVALKARRAPGIGSAIVSCSVACRAAYFESSAVTSYSDTNANAATTVTTAFRQRDLAMIIAECEMQNAECKLRTQNAECTGAPSILHSAVCISALMLMVDHVMDSPATCHKSERDRIRERRDDQRAKKRANGVRKEQRFQNCDETMPEF